MKTRPDPLSGKPYFNLIPQIPPRCRLIATGAIALSAAATHDWRNPVDEATIERIR